MNTSDDPLWTATRPPLNPAGDVDLPRWLRQLADQVQAHPLRDYQFNTVAATRRAPCDGTNGHIPEDCQHTHREFIPGAVQVGLTLTWGDWSEAEEPS
jgi:hypothetical protein